MFKKILSLLTCGILVFTSTTVMATTTKPTKKTTVKKVTTAKKVTPKKPVAKKQTTKKVVVKYGKLSGVITWQYNEFIGTKPDVDAEIYLFNESFNPKKLTKEEKDLLEHGLVMDELKKYGVYETRANGYGQYHFNNVITGSYVIVVVSSKTTRDESQDMDYSYLLKDFVNYKNFKDSFLFYKYTVSEVQISQNQAETFDYDFGYTDH